MRLPLLVLGALLTACAAPQTVGTGAAGSASAPAVRSSKIECRVLLPEAPIPGLHGHMISMLQVTVAAGHDAHRHQHDFVEYMHVLRGTGSLSIDGRPDTPLSPGMVITIPKKTPHQQRNASATETLVYTATFIEDEEHDVITAYVDEPDTTHGCPHRRP